MSKTKIAISGIGAVGGYYGGLLAARYKDSEDIDIYFISRGENLKEIRENGIEVTEQRDLERMRLHRFPPGQTGKSGKVHHKGPDVLR